MLSPSGYYGLGRCLIHKSHDLTHGGSTIIGLRRLINNNTYLSSEIDPLSSLSLTIRVHSNSYPSKSSYKSINITIHGSSFPVRSHKSV